MVNPKVIIVTQARVNSTRFPEKVLKVINDETLLAIHLNRLKGAKRAWGIVVATTHEDKAGEIVKIAQLAGTMAYQGSTDDVLDRFYNAVKDIAPDYVVRVTSDCPLIDPQLVDDVIAFAIDKNVDYASNVLIESFPDGQDIEVFRFSALEQAWHGAKLKSEREHVTPFIRNNAGDKGSGVYTSENYHSGKDYSGIRMTVDEPRDFTMIQRLIEDLGTGKTWQDYTNHIIENNLLVINSDITRNEGYLKSLKNDLHE